MELRRITPSAWMSLRHAAVLACVMGAAACRTAQPAVEPRPSADTAPAAGETATRSLHTEADAHFLRMMLVHHAQALEMTALVPERTRRRDIGMAAGRIEAAQRDEMEMMERWLEDRGFPPPDPHAHHQHEGPAMPGMLSRAELDRLAAARDAEFDRLFLEFMIRHHEGALAMVEELFATPGAAQDPEIYQIATHVDADQRAEIARMRMMQQGTLDRGTE